MGIVIETIKTVERFAIENKVTVIDTLVLQVGEMSAMIPKYIEACYPAAVEGTLLKNTKLKLEILPGNGRCRNCGTVFQIILTEGVCPHCYEKGPELLSGNEFRIKEIVGY